MRRRLPIGIQTFREIREDGHYYVDKTALAHRLIDEGKYYFLSRPRRFGKSLFLDTLAELFEGNEPLFRGLFIHERWDWSASHPVIRISFADGVLHSRQELDRRILDILRLNRERLGLPAFPDTDIAGCFGELIRKAHAATGRRVVVLIDEYDKPILDNLDERVTARAMRDGLRNLYSVIKGADAHLRFALLTGVSKFSKVSLFSGLNNLNDITLDPVYSAICGYTDTDVDTVFAPELAGLDREEIRRWYNGYNWLGERVYNPFDVLLLFQKRSFRSWWFETGTPTFLIGLLSERDTWLPELAQLQTDAELLSTFDVDDISTEALMFQTGYLTIQSEERKFDEYRYRMRYPNQEVFLSLNSAILRAWTPNTHATRTHKTRLGDLLLAADFAGLHELFIAFYAGIPHQWYDNTPIARYEGYYASVFYAYFAALGLDIVCEDSSCAGRLDMAVRLSEWIYLFEFKLVDHEPQGRALQQIKDKGYADKYRADGRSIHLVGIEFSRQTRNVVGFEHDTLRFPL